MRKGAKIRIRYTGRLASSNQLSPPGLCLHPLLSQPLPSVFDTSGRKVRCSSLLLQQRC